MLNTASDAVGAAGSWAKEKAGDLMDFIGKPGKLVDKILKIWCRLWRDQWRNT